MQIGFLELLVIAVIVVILFGPNDLPAIMQKLAKLYREIASLKDELSFQMFSVNKPKELINKNKKNEEQPNDG